MVTNEIFAPTFLLDFVTIICIYCTVWSQDTMLQADMGIKPWLYKDHGLELVDFANIIVSLKIRLKLKTVFIVDLANCHHRAPVEIVHANIMFTYLVYSTSP